MKLKYVLILTTNFLGLTAVSDEYTSPTGLECNISNLEKKVLLQHSYHQFDQTPGQGWRAYADKRCYLLSAHLLYEYKQKNRDDLVEWQNRIITWHAGQMYAFNHNYDLAKKRFRGSLDPSEPENTPVLWNDYVHASIAFLEKNIEKLKKHRENIANGPDHNGEKANLAIIDALIECIDRPYSVAYSNCPNKQ